MSAATASERALVGRIAASERWARETDRTAATAPARTAMLAKFEQQVDPDGVLTPEERARRAAHARKAYFTRLALKSAQARRRSKKLAEGAARAEGELAAAGEAS